MQPTLDIVIVNWNAGTQLRECLQSIVETHQDQWGLQRVLIVDNASSDDSWEGLDDLPLPLTIIHNSQNMGFGAACNQGVEGSQASYILFLNPDTRLFEQSLSLPIQTMEQPLHENTGILGIQLIDVEENITRHCARFPGLRTFFYEILGLNRLAPLRFPGVHMTEWDHGESRFVDHVIGAFYLIRRPLFEELGGFDTDYFVYLEDLDLSLRTHQQGLRCYYLSEAKAFHKGGGTSDQVKATRLFYSIRSRLQYGYKHLGPLRGTVLLFATMGIEPLTRIVFALSRKSLSAVKETMSCYVQLWKALPQIIATNHKS